MDSCGRKPGKIATPQISLKLGETVVIRSTKQRIKYYARTVSCLAPIGQIDIQITWAHMVKSSEKIATSQISLKLSEPVLIRSTRHRAKYYAGAVNRFGFQGSDWFSDNTGAYGEKARKNRETSDFVQTR